MRYVALLFFLLPTAAHAELYKCNGTWTNEPCQGEVQNTLQSAPKRTAPTDPDRSQKDSLLHNLRMMQLKARRNYDVEYDISAVEDFCRKPAVTAADCQEKTEHAEDRIGKRVTTVASLKEEEAKEEEKEVRREGDENEVTVVENNNYYRRRRRRPGHRPVRPIPYEGHQEVVTQGSGISVTGTSATGDTTISGTVSGSSTSKKGGLSYKPGPFSR